jgi:hypothetical protein
VRRLPLGFVAERDRSNYQRTAQARNFHFNFQLSSPVKGYMETNDIELLQALWSNNSLSIMLWYLRGPEAHGR